MEDYVKLDIPAKAEFVSLGRLALSGLLRSRGGYSEDAVADLKLALTEACSNSVRHAYDHDQGQVHLEFTVHSDCVTVLIKDEGESLRRNRGREQQGRDDYVRVDEDTRRATGPRMLSTSAWTSFASATPKSALASANASCA